MENLKKKVQAYLDENYSPDLNSYDNDDLKEIDSYLNELNIGKNHHRISKLSRDNQQLDIETKSSKTIFRKK